MADDQTTVPQTLEERFPLANPYDCDLHLSILAMTGLNALARQRGSTADEIGEEAIRFFLRLALPEFVPDEHAVEAATLEAEVEGGGQ